MNAALALLIAKFSGSLRLKSKTATHKVCIHIPFHISHFAVPYLAINDELIFLDVRIDHARSIPSDN
jgi:hypothetical protein